MVAKNKVVVSKIKSRIRINIDEQYSSEIQFSRTTRQLINTFGVQDPASPMFRMVDAEKFKKFVIINLVSRKYSAELPVVIRTSDLYLVAFKSGSGWVEFADTESRPQQFEDAQLLRMTTSYGTLFHQGRNAVFSQEILTAALTYLSKVTVEQIQGTGTQAKTKAEISTVTLEQIQGKGTQVNTETVICGYIAILIFVLCESPRFKHISAALGKCFNGHVIPISGWMKRIVCDWATLSNLARKYSAGSPNDIIPELTSVTGPFVEVYKLVDGIITKEKKKLERVGHLREALGLLTFYKPEKSDRKQLYSSPSH